MKKLIVFILILATLFSTVAFKNDSNPLFAQSGVEKVCFATEYKIDTEGFESVESGNLFFNFCSKSVAQKIYDKHQASAKAIQFYFNSVNIEKLFEDLKFECLQESEIENIKTYCGYSPMFTKFYYLDNKKANLQFAVTQEYVVVGYPIILTGF